MVRPSQRTRARIWGQNGDEADSALSISAQIHLPIVAIANSVNKWPRGAGCASVASQRMRVSIGCIVRPGIGRRAAVEHALWTLIGGEVPDPVALVAVRQ